MSTAMPGPVSPNTGESLADRLERGPMSALDGLDLLIDVCRVLAAAHEGGVVYGDLNPENIQLGGVDRVTLLDSSASQLLAYLSPEQARCDDVDARADIYALGAIAYELLLGVTPFDPARGGNVVAALLHYPPELPSVRWPDIPTSLETLLMSMLAKQPEARPDIAQVLGALYGARAEVMETSGAFTVGDGAKSRSDISFVTLNLEDERGAVASAVPPINWTTPQMSRWGTIAGAMTALVVVLGLGLLFVANPEPDPETATVSLAHGDGAPAGLAAAAAPVLDEAPAPPNSPDSTPTTGFVKVIVNAPEPQITIGGQPVEVPADGASIALEPGEHEIAVAADGYVTEVQTIALRAGEHAALEVSLERQSATASLRKSRTKKHTTTRTRVPRAGEAGATSTETFDVDGTIDPFATTK